MRKKILNLRSILAKKMTERDKKLLEFMSEYVTPERRSRFEEVLQYRTRHITLVLEDIFQSHNASAVLRSCDLTGIQDVHIIENKYVYDINPNIVVGSTKWLDLKKYNYADFNTPEAFETLRAKGYKIVATCPHQNDFTPDTLPLDKPVAIVLGTEKTGLSDYALENADMFLQIPMFGFTESFNISVSAALISYTLTHRLHESDDIAWHLTEEEKDEILLDWIKRTIKHPLELEKTFEQKYRQ